MTAISWVSQVNGDWNVAGNWSTNTVPTSADDVIISASGLTVTISSADVANSLIFDPAQAELLENAGSLTVAGALTVDTGFVSLNEANPIGSVVVNGGVLAFGAADALGVGTVTMNGGELLGTANENIINALNISGGPTIAAAHGTTLNENSINYAISANTTLNIGSPGEDGTVLWHTSAGSFATTTDDIHVQAGTLKAADANFGLLGVAQTTVDPGATVDVAGFTTSISDLLGGGTVTSSGAEVTLTLDAANFSGTISGALVLDFNGGNGGALLSGLTDCAGAILNGALVINSGTYDLVANTNIASTSPSVFINSGLLEKTGIISRVTSNFINHGTLNVLSGSIEFSGGFTNNGVIHGLVTQSDGVTTISAPVPSDFNGDGLSDIFWRNTNGDVEIWNSNGSSGFSGQELGIVGNSYQVAGTGDFNGDGKADILWRNTNGDVFLWNANGVGGFAGQDLGVVGSDWQIAGTGDFNGSGEDGILWRNANGDVELWNANGAGGFAGKDLGVVSSAWQIAGTGDFKGDGQDGVLWRNANGDVELWKSNGAGGFAGQDLGVVGSSWQIEGTGDFNGSGEDGILWRNSNGDVELWNPNFSGGFFGQDLGVVPTSWQIEGTGVFNGSGENGILWRNTNGDVALWAGNGRGASLARTWAWFRTPLRSSLRGGEVENRTVPRPQVVRHSPDPASDDGQDRGYWRSLNRVARFH